jgi:hypothetical protein
VDAWHCNATGYYSGYVSMTGEALSGGGGFGGPGSGNGTNGTAPPDMTMSVTGSMLPTGTAVSGNSTAATTTAAGASSTQNAYSGADATAAA